MCEDLVKRLRNCTSDTVEDCAGCPYQGGYKGTYCMNGLVEEAANAIEELSGLISRYDGETGIKDLQEYTSKYWRELRSQIQNARAEGGMSMEDVVFVRQKQLCEIILNNLFSEDTNRFFENCEFSSYRAAFMQGMNYAAILCNAKLDQYPAVIVHEPPREET